MKIEGELDLVQFRHHVDLVAVTLAKQMKLGDLEIDDFRHQFFRCGKILHCNGLFTPFRESHRIDLFQVVVSNIMADLQIGQALVPPPAPDRIELYEKGKKFGNIAEEKKVKKYDLTGKPFIPQAYKNEEEIIKVQKRAYSKFYLRPFYILKKVFSLRDLRRNIKGLKLFLIMRYSK